MFSIFKSKPLIEQSSADWIFEAYEWALTHFDSQEFFARSRLIQPTNEYFAGSVSSVHEKAETVYTHTRHYAGLTHWPFKLQAPESYQYKPSPQLVIGGNAEMLARNSVTNSMSTIASEELLYLTYNPQQTLKPEDLSSSFAHIMAQYLVIQSQYFPPGGPDYFAEGTELLAIFMGFGVMFANSAYTFRGGCGSCYNGQSNRQATLSESEVLFSMALYCKLKQIPTSDATRYLKKHLKSGYKRALKQINREPEKLNALLSFRHIARD
ncbi:hypothetical protein [Alkalimarinus alittae]|uniref:Uncharacterized protein n=1 Tax=Alkalimarinus alittae TaxID=2961619 RepID=A0ABY6N748_9ALTE|nr:hypothetical protein [Alkalimarinus alittae]UZE97921.1 hypothetical protein NKI27_09365 [Alkalimarinus alittae]